VNFITEVPQKPFRLNLGMDPKSKREREEEED
jgi:hypothetical protein